MFAMRVCDEVAVAGFSYNWRTPNALLHYYEGTRMMDLMRMKSYHDFMAEKKTLAELVRIGVLFDLTEGILTGLWRQVRSSGIYCDVIFKLFDSNMKMCIPTSDYSDGMSSFFHQQVSIWIRLWPFDLWPDNRLVDSWDFEPFDTSTEKTSGSL